MKPGWVRLPGGFLHRPDPVRSGRTLCGSKVDPAERILHVRPPDWPPCIACRDMARARPGAVRDRAIPDEGRPERASRRAETWERAVEDGERHRNESLKAWRSIGWTVLADSRRAHRPNPERPGHLLCGLSDATATSRSRKKPKLDACPRCVALLQRRHDEQSRGTIMVSRPDAVDQYDRARQRSNSIRAFRG
ncbi:hypothetical protein KOI35_03175 [Actinoplanes bogorensis]|uniref:Uncharacterized protein n=1 Tax=Paractinoplanes bogorensis TaxID=1610840 RepID=A0ABS5YG92_9ACTN|nr:hypothetical protein [Actinoplanes bogorensis]MBU2662503.1 hypothetical protein [Actinoplanes bogorensis]